MVYHLIISHLLLVRSIGAVVRYRISNCETVKCILRLHMLKKSILALLGLSVYQTDKETTRKEGERKERGEKKYWEESGGKPKAEIN